MRVLISVDLEGVAGVVDWDDTLPGAPDYEAARGLMTDEASAAVRGILAAKPEAEVLVADAHARFRNILPARLDPRARLVRGYPRAHGMLGGLETGVDAVVLLGHHGHAGAEGAVLAHTMNGAVIREVRCNGRALGEIGLNIAMAASRGAPTVLVSGDDVATAEAREAAAGIHTVEVKRALSGFAADSLHPDEACARIEAAVPAAIAARGDVEPLRFDGPVDLEVDVVRPLVVEYLLLVPGTERSGPVTIRYRAHDFEAAYRMVELVATWSPGAREA
jgi:D-amino peptidase